MRKHLSLFAIGNPEMYHTGDTDTDQIITDIGVTREIQTRNIPGPQTHNR
jgi:hypothetical protein